MEKIILDFPLIGAGFLIFLEKLISTSKSVKVNLMILFEENFVLKGIGIDIIELRRVDQALQRTPRFMERVFTAKEIQECQGKPSPVASFAARFAAKEAIFKSLGVGWTALGWTSLEILNLPSGQPQVNLLGKAQERATLLGVTQIMLSLTHSRDYAAATAVAVGCAANSAD